MYSGTHENQGNQNTYVMHPKTISYCNHLMNLLINGRFNKLAGPKGISILEQQHTDSLHSIKLKAQNMVDNLMYKSQLYYFYPYKEVETQFGSTLTITIIS